MCGSFPYCSSKTPHKRDADEWKKNVRCESGYTACGVLGHSKLTKAYECVDGRNNLESCECDLPPPLSRILRAIYVIVVTD